MSNTDKYGSVSLETLARFSVLPGAGRLIDAFSLIPDGPMRDAVIHLAETTAATYQGHGGAVAPEPIGRINAHAAKTPALRIGRTPPTGSPQEEAVKIRIAQPDLSAAEIAQRVGLSTQQVHQAVYEARKAGAPIPKKTGGGQPLRVVASNDKPTRAKPRLDGSGTQGRAVWHTRFDTLSGQGQAQVTKAAALRGITPQAYLDRRQLALQLAQEGKSYDRILEATGEKDSKVVSAWLSAARGAGHKVPYVTFVRDLTQEPQAAPQKAQEPPPVRKTTEPPPPPASAPMGRIFKTAAEMHAGAAVAVHKAAQRRGMTLQAYEAMRERIVILRRGGLSPSHISADTGQSKQFVKDTLDAAEALGVVFPRLAEHGGMTLEPPQVRERSAG